MKVWNTVLRHLASVALIIWGAQMAEAQDTSASVSTATAIERAQLESLPDSPGAARSAEQAISQNTNNTQSSSTSSASASQSSQSPQPQTSSPPQKAVGTAAAETSNASGVAASQPAGVAIAPAKQRRVRTIVLRVGALAAAGVAIGTVAALSLGTSSKPPGAH
jgi:hypothetical protein